MKFSDTKADNQLEMHMLDDLLLQNKVLNKTIKKNQKNLVNR